MSFYKTTQNGITTTTSFLIAFETMANILTTTITILLNLGGICSIPPQVNKSLSCEANVTSKCSRWSYCENDTCKCFRNHNNIFVCDKQGVRNFLLSCYCLTYNDRLNTTEVGYCFYNCFYYGKFTDLSGTYNAIPRNISQLDDALCGRYDRTGILCGQCRNRKVLPVYSYNMTCIHCSDTGWLNLAKYIAIAYVPLTCFCLIIIILKINIPTSSIQGYVLTCQIISSPVLLRTFVQNLGNEYFKSIYTAMFPISVVFGIWNFDFLRMIDFKICFKISPLTVFTLDLFIALFPLLLIPLSYFIANLYWNNNKVVVLAAYPFKKIVGFLKIKYNYKRTTAHSFSTFIYLSHIKFLSVCYDLLSPVQVCDTANNTTCRWAVFYDASIPYFSKKHIFYAVPAIVVLVTLVWTPIVLLLLNSCRMWHKCLNVLPVQWKVSFYVIMDSFQGCYKDGTEPGTRDCRWFSAMHFIILNVLYLRTFILPQTGNAYFSIILVLTAILFITQDPYKSQFKTHSESVVINLLLLASVSSSFRLRDYYNYDHAIVAIGFILFVFQHVHLLRIFITEFCFRNFKYCY